MAWAGEHWFGSSHYLKIDGRPVVLNFGPIHVKRPGPWREAFEGLSPPPWFLTLPHLWQQAGAGGHFAWLPLQPSRRRPTPAEVRGWLGDYVAYARKGTVMAMAPAFPGFHDIYEEAGQGKSYGFIGGRDGDTLRETLKIALEGPTPVVQLVTWNDYGEGTVIEPTHEQGYRHLEIIVSGRQGELNGRFPFRPGDLRLPAELLRLRRQHRGDRVIRDRLDEAARRLIQGEVSAARKILAGLAEDGRVNLQPEALSCPGDSGAGRHRPRGGGQSWGCHPSRRRR
jgi:hypothetical protein